MSLIPREIIEKLESAETEIAAMNDKFDTLISKLDCIIKELRIGNERQA